MYKQYFYYPYNSSKYHFEPYNLIAEYLYIKKTRLEVELNERYDYLFRFNSRPAPDDIIALYQLKSQYDILVTISKEIYGILHSSDRAYCYSEASEREDLEQDKQEK